MGALAAFCMVWAVFVQNSCQLLPLSRIKLGNLAEGLVRDRVLDGHGLVWTRKGVRQNR